MKGDLEVMDALIESLYEELKKISESHWRARTIMNKLDYQYGLLKKEYKELQKGEQE